MSTSDEYAFLGWQGFGLEHPAAWELNRVRGSRRATYLALDDGESVRLEINWKPVGRKFSIEKLVDRQLKLLEKSAKRRKLEIKLNRKSRIGRVRGFEYEAFTWRADVSACELVARCRECGRVILLRVIGEAEHTPVEAARRVFSSLECYCDKDDERWGTFGLDVKIPMRFDLESSSLRAGLCELVFTDRRLELRLTRASMARAVLEKQKMAPWYEKTAAAILKPFELTWREETFRGHIGYRVSGKVRLIQKLLGLFRGNRKLSAHCFYCEPSDKIFAVTAVGARGSDELVEAVREGIVCHR